MTVTGHHYTSTRVRGLAEWTPKLETLRVIEQVRDQLDASERQKRAYKGAATRARNQVERAENGVCPHCNRSFQDLRRHMESKHP